MRQDSVVVLDSGGCTCKVGFAGHTNPQVFPNCTGRAKGVRQNLVGQQLLKGQDVSALKLRRPVDRGYVVNWDLEREIWNHAFTILSNAEPATSGLLLTEPMFSLPAMQEAMQQVVFEDFGFQSLCSCPAPLLSLQHMKNTAQLLPAHQAGCALVLDAGFSFTHAVPIFSNVVLDSGVRRQNLGGKVLTNYLKELVSYRSVNLMEETYLVEHIKDAVCFVSDDLRADLKAAQQSSSPHRIEYVLPDGLTNLKGFARTPETVVRGKHAGPMQPAKELAVALNNERFLVPELLFHPSDISLPQAGVAELIHDAVSAVHQDLHGLLYSNIILSGGTCCCPGFRDRLVKELRPLVPDQFDLNVSMPENPITCAWQGGSSFAATPDYLEMALTKHEYEEQGFERLQHMSSA